jgi:hypothetical protein
MMSAHASARWHDQLSAAHGSVNTNDASCSLAVRSALGQRLALPLLV